MKVGYMPLKGILLSVITGFFILSNSPLLMDLLESRISYLLQCRHINQLLTLPFLEYTHKTLFLPFQILYAQPNKNSLLGSKVVLRLVVAH